MHPWGYMPSYSMQGPTIKKLCGMSTRLSGGRILEFGDDFFSWLDQQIAVVDDYAYVGMNFSGDQDMVFLDEEDFDDYLGKFLNIFHFL